MKLHYKILCFLFLILGISIHSQESDKTVYLDENNIEVSRKEFYKLKKEYAIFVATHDSLNLLKLVRESHLEGTLSNKRLLFDVLEEGLKISLSSNKPLVIVYHPGKNPCNSSGTATAESTRDAFSKMELAAKKITDFNILYIYKNDDGLKSRKTLPWKKDPQRIIEKTFFKYHYPCSSYVVIGSKNIFRVAYGEIAKESVLQDLKELQ